MDTDRQEPETKESYEQLFDLMEQQEKKIKIEGADDEELRRLLKRDPYALLVAICKLTFSNTIQIGRLEEIVKTFFPKIPQS